MKWYKHFSDALDDPFIQALMDKFGHKGYVAWFGLIEIIAKESGTELTGKLDISPTYLKRKLRISTTKLSQIFHFCDTFAKVSVNFSENNWHFDMPKMLELKDNYTRDLEVASKKPSKHKEEEVEEEVEEEKEEDKKQRYLEKAKKENGKGKRNVVMDSEEIKSKRIYMRNEYVKDGSKKEANNERDKNNKIKKKGK